MSATFPAITRPPGDTTLDRLREDEAEAFVPVLDLWLRPGQACSASVEQPLLVGPGAPALRRVVRRDGIPVSHGALHRLAYRLPGARLSVGIIGAVATAPAERGRGHAGRIVRTLVDDARAAGADVLVLWSEADALYLREGFVRGGCERLHLARLGNLARIRRRTRARPLRFEDVSTVIAMHQRQPAGTVRSPAEWQAALALPRTEWYVLEDRSEIVAYGVVGKGADLEGCLHEWGGEETALPELCAGILGLRCVEELVVMSPPWKTTAERAMDYCGIPAVTGVLGMIRILEPEALCRRLGRGDVWEAAGGDPAGVALRLFGGPPDHPPAVPFHLSGLDSM